MIVFMVSEMDDTGPCFTRITDAEALKKRMETKTDGSFYVTPLWVDHSLDEGEKILARSWHQPPEPEVAADPAVPVEKLPTHSAPHKILSVGHISHMGIPGHLQTHDTTGFDVGAVIVCEYATGKWTALPKECTVIFGNKRTCEHGTKECGVAHHALDSSTCSTCGEEPHPNVPCFYLTENK